ERRHNRSKRSPRTVRAACCIGHIFFTVRATYQVPSDIALLNPAPPDPSNNLLHPRLISQQKPLHSDQSDILLEAGLPRSNRSPQSHMVPFPSIQAASCSSGRLDTRYYVHPRTRLSSSSGGLPLVRVYPLL